ncbi:putative tartrate dehydrogenase/decarboxylase TtuC' [compost metagenome]
MQSAVLLLNHLGEKTAAAGLQTAIYNVYAEGKYLTPDVGGTASTADFTDAVIRNLELPSAA